MASDVVSVAVGLQCSGGQGGGGRVGGYVGLWTGGVSLSVYVGVRLVIPEQGNSFLHWT